jgi:alginate O-acetyltransferase complex protein AlgI
MGGSRKGTTRRYINLLVTMILGGLWHGANYTFIVWGILHGAALCIHKLFLQWRKDKATSRIGSTVSVAVTYIFVCVCWVFFRAPDFQIAMDVLTKMFIWTNGITQIFSWSIFGIIGVAICTLLAYVKAKSNNQTHINGYYAILDLTKTFHLFLFFLTIMLTICLAYTNANPFIYFQF